MSGRVLIVLSAALIAAVAAGLATIPSARPWVLARLSPGRGLQEPRPSAAATRSDPAVELIPGAAPTIRVAADVVRSMRLKVEPVVPPSRPRSLTMAGSLALDTNRLAHVHTRFVGEVVELGTIVDAAEGTVGGRPVERALQFGDRVEKGQLLAVLWSSELGEKKCEYIDALSRLRLEKETLGRLETLFRDDAVAERNLREARRNVEAAEIAVARVERTLQAWRLSNEEVAAIRAEADLIRQRKARSDGPVERSWARVELRSPLKGTVLEKNLAVGDIVETTTDLFKIADLGRLRVWAYIYEEDLPKLLGMPTPVPWTVRLNSDPRMPPMPGRIERVGDIIDPSQHTALVIGEVDNPDGRLRAGQFVTAIVELPGEGGEVEVPVSAIVDDGEEAIVFVQPDPDAPAYAMKRVVVLRRSGSRAVVRGLPDTPGNADAPTLAGGQRVVSSGAIELKAALLNLRSAIRGEGEPAGAPGAGGTAP